MKKLILLMSLILIVTLGGYSQLTPVKTTRVANATTAFGENVAVGSQVYDYGAEELYVCKRHQQVR